MYAYNVAMYCDDCSYDIMEELNYDDSGDTDDYPQHVNNDEADCPQHCDGCGEFLGNSLTSDGADYVINAVRRDMEGGRFDSVACTVWRDYYSWLDYPEWGVCERCGAEGILTEDDDYVECCDNCLEALVCEEGDYYPYPFTD